MSITANFPAIKPSILLDFANSQQLDPRVTFSRSTTAPYYDGKTSVLAEQNLLLYSNTFSNSAWVATSATIASGVTDPAGGTTAFSMTATAGNATLYQTLTLTATAYTESIYIQRVTGTGTINLTLDGSTLSPVTITGSWAKYTYTATPSAGSRTIGIQIVTSGDAINIYGSQLENRSSATATNITTTTAITNYIPQLLTAPINAPRFDFNPTTGESLGLLIEQSSTNLQLQSSSFNTGWNNGSYGAYNLTALANIAPDGTQTAYKLYDTTTNTLTYINYQSASTTSGTTLTASVYLKAAERTRAFVYLMFQVPNIWAAVDVNLSTGVISAIANPNAIYINSTITPVGNGWYRVSVTGSQAIGTYFAGVGITAASATDKFSYAQSGHVGDGYSGIYIWGAQLEALAFPTSYIATTSAQVTRASDNASMTGTNFSSWFNNQQGTQYIESQPSQNAGALFGGLGAGATISGSGYFLLSYATTNGMLYSVSGGSNIQLSSGASALGLSNSFYKIAGSLQMNSTSAVVFNGTNSNSTTFTGQMPIVNQLYFGGTSFSNYVGFGGRIKKYAYYPQALTATQLQALTGS